MVTRISGMASGMDIDSLVKSLMATRQGPLNKLNQQKQILEWQRDDYRKMSTKLVTFMQDSISKLSQSSTINAQKATVTGNTGALTATASSSASGTFEVKVKQLASASQTVSDGDVNQAKNDPLLSTVAGGALSLTINGETITADSTAKVSDFVKQINANTKAGVTAVYDSTSGKMSLTNKTSGSTAVDVSGTLAGSSGFNFKAVAGSGQNSIIEVNGLEISNAKNQVEVNGVTLTLNAVTQAGDAATTITVTKDTDKVVKAVQDFVTAYNDVLSSVNSKIGEERYKKYTPLTSEQRKEMSDDEAKLWDDKAKSGMLKNESILQRTVSDMRSAFIQGVDIGRTEVVGGVTKSKPLTMTELGITTGTYDTKGKISVDVDKLKAALNDNPDIVNQFFGQNYSKATLNNNYAAEDGILAKMRKISTGSLASLAEKAGTSKVSSDLTSTFLATSLMGQRLTSIDREITGWNSRLNRIETNYYKQFTAMETAMNKYNTTMSSLSSM
ncbi:flagellar filament capping protein FliD [Saccharibacillus sp. JS10]|uniref:flagellar filament capping protein FliD n=1 Tax=Saccharibacillus sp. JS10 TaxID=2950552 RepID=UPI00210DDB19|nr:flagellar filament capping protein FliD [Saccharibacillus sp. JS10]MCQ4088817.1 flagellar filament capping protein FliD [Saccharibacillus sp. JS10]